MVTLQKEHRASWRTCFALGKKQAQFWLRNSVSSIVSLSLLPNFKEGELGRKGLGSRAPSFGQCAPLSGQTAVWFPVSGSGITASDDKLGLRKGQIRLENENAKKPS